MGDYPDKKSYLITSRTHFVSKFDLEEFCVWIYGIYEEEEAYEEFLEKDD